MHLNYTYLSYMETTDIFNKNTALLTIDMQNDFSKKESPFYIDGTQKVIKNIAKVVQAFRNHGLPVIHIVRLYLQDGSNADICRRELLKSGAHIVIPGSKGSELVEEISPSGSVLIPDLLLTGKPQELADNEFVIYKPRWGAFYNTSLESFLREKSINNLVFTGCNFPNCPRTSIYEASERDFNISLVSDALSRLYTKGIQELKAIGCLIVSTNDLMKYSNPDLFF